MGLVGGGVRFAPTAMELHILEHRVRVLSLARPGLWLYTHPLIKLLFLPRRNRCAPGFRATDWGWAPLLLRDGVRRLGLPRGERG